jgi:hypothetical protein
MLVQKDGQWVFVSRKTRRPLAYYKGEGKPSEGWVKKQEARVQHFKHMSEASYQGNIGAMEMFKFHQKANDEQKKKLQSLIQKKDTKGAWKHIQDVTGTKLHKSVYEAVEKDILPVSGAGQWGTDELRKKYQKDTPGQNVKTFNDYLKTK